MHCGKLVRKQLMTKRRGSNILVETMHVLCMVEILDSDYLNVYTRNECKVQSTLRL